MKDYLILFIDKDECLIKRYSLVSKTALRAMESAMQIFEQENEDIDTVSEIRIVIVD